MTQTGCLTLRSTPFASLSGRSDKAMQRMVTSNIPPIFDYPRHSQHSRPWMVTVSTAAQ
jgi:hypothetical protein